MWPQMWTVSTVSSVDFVSVVSSVDQGMCGRRCGLWSQVWTVVSVDCFLTCVPQCCMIRCISSCTSSTHRRLGSSRRRICRFTRSSKDTSGTKRAGRGPCKGGGGGDSTHINTVVQPISAACK